MSRVMDRCGRKPLLPGGRAWREAWDMVGKAEVIRRRGRAAWEALPRGEKHRRGHRQFITYRTFLEMRI